MPKTIQSERVVWLWVSYYRHENGPVEYGTIHALVDRDRGYDSQELACGERMHSYSRGFFVAMAPSIKLLPFKALDGHFCVPCVTELLRHCRSMQALPRAYFSLSTTAVHRPYREPNMTVGCPCPRCGGYLLFNWEGEGRPFCIGCGAEINASGKVSFFS